MQRPVDDTDGELESTRSIFSARLPVDDQSGGARIADRYELGEEFDAGGCGVVHRGTDLLTGRPVAIKILEGYHPSRILRIRNEIATLRLLRIPGVVRMLDEAAVGDRFHIVMELIDGTPFPGPGRQGSWTDLQPVTRRLLQILARVHGSHVIHRDLKPGNVLVTPKGEVVVLDFGLSALRRETVRRTAEGQFVGTPAYMSPEQFLGSGGDERSDLYSVGVMLFEALSGRLPHRGTRREVLLAKLNQDAPTLGSIARDVPPEISTLVDRLLAREIEDRPANALEVLSTISDEPLPGTEHFELPHLGTRNAVRALFRGPDRLHHLAEDAATELWNRTGGDPDRLACEIQAWTETSLVHWQDGLVVIDRPTLDSLASGLRLPTSSGGKPIEASPGESHSDLLAAVELAGPNARIEILSGILGRPADELTRELGILKTRGLIADRPDGGLESRTDESASTRWPQERRSALHGALVRALPRGTEGRLLHCVAAGVYEEVAEEAIAESRRNAAAGRVGRATALITEGLLAVRAVPEVPGQDELLESLLRLALDAGTTAALDHLLYESGRSVRPTARTETIETLARAAMDALTGDGAYGLRILDELPELEPTSLERSRQSIRVFAARRISPELHAKVVEELERWVEALGEEEVVAWYAGVRGWVRYGQGRYRDAAAEHCRALESTKSSSFALSASLNSSSALLECGEYAEAEELAREALVLAAARRHGLGEARAEQLIRAIEYRSGRMLSVDHELVEAAASLGVPHLAGLITLTEAAVAWRNGNLEEARSLADRATALWSETGRTRSKLVSMALAAACGAPVEKDEVRSMAEEAQAFPVADLGAQVLGLLALASPELAPELQASARKLAEMYPVHTRGLRRDVLSLEESIGG